MTHYLDGFRSIPEAFYHIAAKHPDKIVYRQALVQPGDDFDPNPRRWEAVTYQNVKLRVVSIANYLLSLGLGKGARAAIVSNTRPEWMEADLGILSIGGAAVSVYQSLTAHEIGYILYDSGAEVIFAENQEQVGKILSLVNSKFTIPSTEERPSTDVGVTIKKIISFERVSEHPLVVCIKDIFENGGMMHEPPKQAFELSRDDLAGLVYTSGTTGAPKGVIQSHGNHLANVRQGNQADLYNDNSIIFLFLPLAHSFAKLMGYIGFLTPASLSFPGITDTKSSKADPHSLMRDLREAGAEVFPMVPRILEKMQAALIGRAQKRGLTPFVLRHALRSARNVFESKQSGKSASILSRIVFEATDGVRGKIREKLFGPKFQYCISGGAKLPIEAGTFFLSIGIEVLEGYGLTETCVATNVNRVGKVKLGTVGPVLSPDIEIKFGSDGEIMFRGPNITRGYLNRGTATKEAWDNEGWFRTGDLGSLDSDGYLRIEGRKKELIVTSGGKKIAPDMIEQKLKASPYISQAVMVGEGRKYCAALVTLERDNVIEWSRTHNVKLVAELHQDQKVFDLIWKEVEKVNSSLASYESIKKITILAEELSIENGMLTPTLKVKRKEVIKRFGALIEGMY